MFCALVRSPRCLVVVAACTFALATARDAAAQGIRPPVSEPYLFFNYYVPPNPVAGVGAAMYPSPRTTIPPHVGWTYITYQPLMPHEFMYRHCRTYFRYHPGSGWTKGKIAWCW